MSASKGSMVLLKIGDGAVPSESFTTIGGLRLTRMTINRQVVAVADMAGSGWRQALPQAGIANIRVQAQGIFQNSVAEQVMQMQALAGSMAHYRLCFGNGDRLTGAFVVASYERNGKTGEMEGFAVVLESADAMSFDVA